MTQQRWERIRELREVPMDIWFEYYLEKGGLIQDKDVFRQFFEEIIGSNSYIRNSEGRLIKINLNTALNRLYNYYNEKFL